jgi:hypothetical protein
MACLALPAIPPLNLPFPISLATPTIPINVDVDFCCNFPLFAITIPVAVLTITSEVLGPINAIILEVDTILAELTVSCPWQ